MSGPVLQTHGLVRRFGGLVATNDVSLTVQPGARHALIGPNGAGKTTLINLLTGFLTPTAGRIELRGEDITHSPEHQRVRRGLVRTFQINQLFATLTPMESLAIAVSQRLGQGTRWWQRLGTDPQVARRCEELLTEYHLTDVMHQRTELLPYGKRRLLEIALAIAGDPLVLLLDEPAAGVPEGDRQEIFDSLGRLPKEVAVLLIEHDMDLVFSFATHVSVLVSGAMFAEGSVQEIAHDPRVKAVYLGEPHV